MSRSEWATRIWVVLVGAAHNRQTIRYPVLAELIGFQGPGLWLSQPLGRIMRFCDQHQPRLPPLTVLAVGENGRPSEGLTTSDDHDRDRESVFGHSWYQMQPPRVTDFDQFAHLDGADINPPGQNPAATPPSGQ